MAKNEFISTLRFSGYMRGEKAKKVKKGPRQHFSKSKDQNKSHNSNKNSTNKQMHYKEH